MSNPDYLHRNRDHPYLKSLVEIDVLREKQVGKEKLFLHPRLLQLLKDDGNRVTAYAE